MSPVLSMLPLTGGVSGTESPEITTLLIGMLLGGALLWWGIRPMTAWWCDDCGEWCPEQTCDECHQHLDRGVQIPAYRTAHRDEQREFTKEFNAGPRLVDPHAGERGDRDRIDHRTTMLEQIQSPRADGGEDRDRDRDRDRSEQGQGGEWV